MPTAYINIGSNKGDRHALTGRAVALIMQAWADGEARLSEPYESEPWGFDSANNFINICVAVDIGNDTPLQVLERLQNIERTISDTPHRNADGTYRDRAIDIDIIAIDNLTIDTPRLTVPHPRAALRDFVMIPLRQIAPKSIVDHVKASHRG